MLANSSIWAFTGESCGAKDRQEAALWHKRAAQMRAFAEEAVDPETKRMMLSIALAYEGLAEREEERRRKE